MSSFLHLTHYTFKLFYQLPHYTSPSTPQRMSQWNSSTSTLDDFKLTPTTTSPPTSTTKRISRFARIKSRAKKQHQTEKQQRLLSKQREREERSRLAQEKLARERETDAKEAKEHAMFEQLGQDLKERKTALSNDTDQRPVLLEEELTTVTSVGKVSMKTDIIVGNTTDKVEDTIVAKNDKDNLEDNLEDNADVSIWQYVDSEQDSAEVSSSTSTTSTTSTTPATPTTPTISSISHVPISTAQSLSTVPPSSVAVQATPHVHVPAVQAPQAPQARRPINTATAVPDDSINTTTTKTQSTATTTKIKAKIKAKTTSKETSSIESLLKSTAPMVGLSATWREDLEQHQLNYMSSLTDPGVFTAELLRTKEQQRHARVMEKQRLNNTGATTADLKLSDLVLYVNKPMSHVVLQQMCRNLRPSSGATLCELCLDNTNMNDDALGELSLALVKNVHLTALSMAHNQVTSKGIVSLAKALKKSESTALRSLNVAENAIGDNGVAALSAVLHDTVLQAINFTAVGAGDIGAKHLALALSVKRTKRNGRPRLPSFPMLSYAGNKLTPDGLLYFASCVVQNKSICSLHLNGNVQLGDRAAVILADLLRCFTSLTEVSVENIGLTREGMSTLFEACEESDSVHTLNVGSNEIDDLQSISVEAQKYQISHLKLSRRK
jgi:hypothetical protein